MVGRLFGDWAGDHTIGRAIPATDLLLVVLSMMISDAILHDPNHGLALIQAWISNYIHYKVWDEITHPFLNFNGATVDV